MNNYALLTFSKGVCDRTGLSEIRFHYPLTRPREFQLFNEAISIVKQNTESIRIFWNLLGEKDQDNFKKYFEETEKNELEMVIVPDSIGHGDIMFRLSFCFKGYYEKDRELLVQRFVDSGIPPCDNALERFFAYNKRKIESSGGQTSEEEINREIRSTFSRNLTFHSE